jgi:anti-sigma B factor antagonist
LWRRKAFLSTCIPAKSLAKEVLVPSGPPIKLSTRLQGDVTILDLTGDITLFNSPEIRKALIGLLKEQRVPQLFVNMTGVKYVDSSGIASLVEGLKMARDLGSRFVLYGLSKPAITVLELTHLLRVFEVHTNETEALAALPPNVKKITASTGDGTGESA